MTGTYNIKLLFLGCLARNTLNISHLPPPQKYLIVRQLQTQADFSALIIIKSMRFLFKNIYSKLLAAFLLIGVLQLSGFDVQAQTHSAGASKTKATVFIYTDLKIVNVGEIKGDIFYVCTNERKTEDAEIKTYGRTAAYNLDVQGQTHSTNASENADIIFIGGDITIANAEDIKGNISFIYAAKEIIIEDITTSQRIISENADYQQTELVQNGAKIKKTYKETVYSPLSPFGDAAFINGCTAVNAVLPVQSNHSHKLFCQNFTQIFFTPIFDSASKYFTNNNFVVHKNVSFACAQGNLPPPLNL